MMVVTPVYIENIAKEFWAKIGRSRSQPPYDIAGAVSLLLPLDIISLSELTLLGIDKWLNDRGIKIPVTVSDRHLHGFVLIRNGSGFMFINGTDSEEERKYTIAHETSHFILDYKIPRDRVIEKLGKEVGAVLDGVRAPTVNEQVNSLIKEISLDAFTHLFEKEGDGSFESFKVFNAENNADLLALELLAPHSEVIKTTQNGRGKISFDVFDQQCFDLLVSSYKLPHSIARQYSKRLAYLTTGGPSIMSKLGF